MSAKPNQITALPTIDGYRIVGILHESPRTLVLRGEAFADGAPVVLKLRQPSAVTAASLRELRREFDLVQRVRGPGLPEARELAEGRFGLALVTRDVGGRTLAEHLAAGALGPEAALRIGLKLAEALDHLHGLHVVHRDLSPANVVWNPEADELRLVDFDLAERLPPPPRVLPPQKTLVGTLAYLSPEQTGRTNHPVDERSDLYALGAVLYEVLCGKPPFTAEDPLELVHAHLAKAVAWPVGAVCPPSLRAIVARLLAKAPEDRYQSSYGVWRDLQACRAGEQPGDRSHAVSRTLTLDGPLVGRDGETARIEAELAACGGTAPRLLLIGGSTGSGKTALLEAAARAAGTRPGLVGLAALEPSATLPYAGLAKALTAAMQPLLLRPEAELAPLVARLRTALGPNASFLAALVSPLRVLLGDVGAPPDVPVREAENRFHIAVDDLVTALAAPGAPLLLLLDDLQWADSGTVQLVQRLVTESSARGVLVVGSYRSDELPAEHPLRTHLLPLAGTLALSPLGVDAVRALLARALAAAPMECDGLAQIALAKTGGNPQTLGHFVEQSRERGLIRFDREAGRWRWDEAGLAAAPVVGAMGDVMAGRLDEAPAAVREALAVAACLGERFSGELLAAVSARGSAPGPGQGASPLDPRLELLGEAVAGGFLVRDGEAYRFAHPRVRSAARDRLPPAARAAIHRQAGLALLAALPAGAAPSEDLFAAADQLSRGADLAQTPAERQQLAEVCFAAGGRAKSLAAYDAAYGYLHRALDHGAGAPFLTRIREPLAEVAYLTGRVEECLALVETLLASADSLAARTRAQLIAIEARVAQKDVKGAVATGIALLAELGVDLPAASTPLTLARGLVRTKLALSGRKIESLADLPPMTDERKLLAFQVMNTIMAPIFIACPDIFPLLVFNLVTLSVRYGNCPFSALGYAAYGLASCAYMNDIPGGHRYGLLAQGLATRLGDTSLQVQVNHVFFHYVDHWRRPLRDGLATLDTDARRALVHGDWTYAAYDKFVYSYHLFFSGERLGLARERMMACFEDMQRLKQEPILQGQRIYCQLVQTLMDGGPDPVTLSGQVMDERELLVQAQAAANHLAVFGIHSSKLFLALLYDDPVAAAAAIQASEPLLKHASGMTIGVVHRCQVALAHFAAARTAKGSERRKRLAKASREIRRFRKWAQLSPENHTHRLRLLEAARASALGHPDAAERFTEAIRTAEACGYRGEAALAAELAARHHQARGEREPADARLKEAHQAYERWEAHAKVAEIERRRPDLFARAATGASGSQRPDQGVDLNQALDLGAVLEASKSISSRISLSELVATILGVVTRTSGGETSILLLKGEDGWRSEGELRVDGGADGLLASRPPEGLLPLTVLAYVERTLEPLVIADASADGTLATDDFVRTHRPKSLLGYPLLNQGRLSGILFARNDQVAGAFTPERLGLLGMISSQAAIAIDNARLYADLEARVEARTRELQAALDDLRVAQAKLVESEKMAALGGLVAGVAHEINTPLGIGITAASSLADETAEMTQSLATGLKKSRLEAYLRTVGEGAGIVVSSLRTAARLTESFKRLAVDASLGERARFDLGGALDELAPGLGLKARELGHALTVRCEPGLGLAGDPGELTQIVTNLVMNALQHGCKELRDRRVEVTAARDGAAARLEVRDDGRGIPAEHLGKIYDPFFTTQRGEGRTGLGLNIVYGLVTRKFNGSIECQSQVGQGTVFTLRIPLAGDQSHDP